MTISNHTHWRTDHIRAFISRIAKIELDGHWAAKMKRLHVEVVYTRPGRRREEHRGYSSGLATLRGAWMKLRLSSTAPDKIDFAHTVAHEMAHLRGMHHPAMAGMPEYCRVGDWRERYGWALDMPLERTPPKPKVDRPEQRRAKAEAMLATWQRKLKLARTKVKHYERKVNYYARRTTLRGSWGNPALTLTVIPPI